jgi:hypothetical protein
MAELEDKKSGGSSPPASTPPTASARIALGRQAAMVAVVFALVASAVFRWAVVGIWRGQPVEVVPAVSAQGAW